MDEFKIQDKAEFGVGFFYGFILNIVSLFTRPKDNRNPSREYGRKTGILLSSIILISLAVSLFSYNSYRLDKEERAARRGRPYYKAYTYSEYVL